MASNDIIKFEYNGAVYTLEFDRESAMKAERGMNISLSELTSGKTYLVRDLFAAALIKHHPNMKGSTIQTLFDLMTDKSGLYERLVKMYAEAANTLLEDPEEGNGISWKAE